MYVGERGHDSDRFDLEEALFSYCSLALSSQHARTWGCIKQSLSDGLIGGKVGSQLKGLRR